MVLLQKLTARVFGASRGMGGNPVTIFLPVAGSTDILLPALEQSLAKSCEWESVLISPPTTGATPPQLKFFVPSGNELSFCAHAAMGAAYALHGAQASQSDGSIASNTVAFQTADGEQQTAHIHDDDTVFLNLDSVSYEEVVLPLVNTEAILDQVGLDMMYVLNLPLNAAVAGRFKTLVQVALDVLQDETQSAPTSALAFRDNCLLSKESTGLYLYADTTADGNANNIVNLECRQFPSDSGYPEDPATGIAAAALAVRLSQQVKYQDASTFQIAQGTAMGRPSRITIQNIEFQEGSDNSVVSLQCGGRVEIDETEEIQV